MEKTINLQQDEKLIFDPKPHRYTYEGKPLTSVSRILGKLAQPFDKNIAVFVAKKEGVTTEEILRKWDYERDRSIEIGNYIHENMESYFKKGYCEKELLFTAKQAIQYCMPSQKIHSEFMVRHLPSGTCGTADIVIERTKVTSKTDLIVDIGDFKTNVNNGITYTSSYFSDNIWKHLNKFFYDPISHLEYCEYNKYALQMSLYAYMLQSQFPDIKIGRLFILYVSLNYQIERIPVPYLRNEAEQILNIKA